MFTHFAEWGKRLAEHLTARTGVPTDCYHGGLSRGVRDKMIADFQARKGKAAADEGDDDEEPVQEKKAKGGKKKKASKAQAEEDEPVKEENTEDDE